MPDSDLIDAAFRRYAELEAKTSPASRAYMESHRRRFLETIRLIPGQRRLAVLDLGTFLPLAAILRAVTPHAYTWHGHWEGEREKEIAYLGQNFLLHNFDVETDPFPFPDGQFDLVLCMEVLEHLGLDPLFMISEINRVLKPGGALLLTTPNINATRNIGKMLLGYSPYLYASFTLNHDRHNREYSPNEIHPLLVEGGFLPEKIFTRNVYFLDNAFSLRRFFGNLVLKAALKLFDTSQWRGDTIFSLSRKQGPVLHRYPPQFYDLPADFPQATNR
jgi:SAM-dependent methyltransferase